MRAKRSKQYRKLMQQYGFSFGFREPYQVLLDADIIRDAASHKMRLGSLLEGTLHGEIKPMITQCCIRHLYSSEIDAKDPMARQTKDGWIEVAKGAERRRCGHHELETPLSAKECLESVVDPKNSGANKHRYVVASQDQEVRKCMRGIAGVPLIYINRSVMILEPMAGKSSEAREREERAKVRAGLKSRRGTGAEVIQMKRSREDDEHQQGRDTGAPTGAPQPKKQKKSNGPKGPNPLSVKKAKPDNSKKEDAAKKGSEDGKNQATQRAAPSKNDDDESHVSKPTPADGEEGKSDGAKRKRKRKPKNNDIEASADVEDADDNADD